MTHQFLTDLCANPQDLSARELLNLKASGLPQIRAKDSVPVESGERTLTYIASDETPDRMGDVIQVAGWNLTTYKRNPVILWGHDTSNVPPIGRATNVRRSVMENGKPALLASVEFAPPEAHEFADTIYQLSKGGFLNAVSVGFMPREAQEATEKEKAELGMPPYGVIYSSADLLEISVVSVPANPSALVTGAKSLAAAGLVGDRTVDRFLKTIPMTEDEMAQRLKAKIRGFVDLGAHTKAEPGTLSVGDVVRWDSSGGSAEGQIERIEDGGTIDIPDSSFSVEGTEEDPAALIRVYRDGEASDTLVGHKFSTLTKVRAFVGSETKGPACREEGETQAECVERKVPELLEEGMESDQAVAVANELCETACTEERSAKNMGVAEALGHLRMAMECLMNLEDYDDEEMGMKPDEEERGSGYKDEEEEEKEKSLTSSFAHLVDAQAEQARALSTLVDSVSDLTVRIRDFGGERAGGHGSPDGTSPAPASPPAEDASLRSVTEDFLNRLQQLNHAEH